MAREFLTIPGRQATLASCSRLESPRIASRSRSSAKTIPGTRIAPCAGIRQAKAPALSITSSSQRKPMGRWGNYHSRRSGEFPVGHAEVVQGVVEPLDGLAVLRGLLRRVAKAEDVLGDISDVRRRHLLRVVFEEVRDIRQVQHPLPPFAALD